eukprot:scaffold7888_cov167-Cylindrotheca_fusiformis.AAC.1
MAAEANAPLEDDLFAYEWAPNVPILNIDRPAPCHEAPAKGANNDDDMEDEDEEDKTDEDETNYKDEEEEEEDKESDDDTDFDEEEEVSSDEVSNEDTDDSEEQIIFDLDDGRDDLLFCWPNVRKLHVAHYLVLR